MNYEDLEELTTQYYNAREKLWMLINRHINLYNIRKQDKFVDFSIGFDFKGGSVVYTLIYAYFEFGDTGERDCNPETINLKDIEL